MEELLNELKKHILKNLLEIGIDEDYIEYEDYIGYEVDEFIYNDFDN